MSIHLILFLAFGAVAVAGAVNLLAQTHPINSALSLIAVMAALAGEYLLLGAEFVAAVQVIVYAGAIMVLFVFTIMLLNAGVEERTKGSRVAMLFGIPGMLVGSVLVAWVVLRHSGTEAVAAGALPTHMDEVIDKLAGASIDVVRERQQRLAHAIANLPPVGKPSSPTSTASTTSSAASLSSTSRRSKASPVSSASRRP